MFLKSLCSLNTTWCRKIFFYNRIYRTSQTTIKLYCTNPKPTCNIGTIGHVDHGKTTLTADITKVLEKDGLSKFVDYDQIDKAPEEKARDCAILVVAATDGSMPQTREHLLLIKQVGVQHVVVFINKCDITENDVIELVELEIRELLTDFGFNGHEIPCIFGSALLALKGDTSELGEQSIRKLMDVIDNNIPTPKRDFTSPFLLPIDNCLLVPGRGAVVIGTLKRGTVCKNDKVELLGFDEKKITSVSDIHVFKNSVASAKAGENVGLLLRGLKPKFIRKGMILCPINTLTLKNRFKATIYFLLRSEGGRSKPITSNYQQQLFSHTWNIFCRIDLNSSVSMVMPGEHAEVIITLLNKMIMDIGQPFTIRENGRTVATGIISEVLSNVHVSKNNLSKVNAES